MTSLNLNISIRDLLTESESMS